MGWSLSDVGNALGTAATGGAWSPDGKSGYAQGGGGMFDVFSGSSKSGNSESSLKSFIPGIGDAMAQDKANRANLAESALNRQFQAQMSNTAYQRAMLDMKQAGLNPMLAFSQGGASTPSGSTAQVQSASKTGFVDKAMGAVSGIAGFQQQQTALQQQNQMNESAIKLNTSTAAKNLAQTRSTEIENNRNKKYEGVNTAAGRVGDKIGGAMNKLMDMMDTTAKDQTNKWKDATKPYERKIKVLGPVSAKENLNFNRFQTQKP